ncbi:MAG TPA: 3-oxoadipate enol-lactonase [Candidatus Acidoferrales bacterium]|nr:3-oxoadipate enol-lactonase [Candidatus Acidoferrales bacterium]
MPTATLPDLRVNYALSGPDGAAVVIFSNSLGANFSMWDPQMPLLEKRYRVVRYDTRGEGLTSVLPGPYRIEQLGDDVLRLMDFLGVARAHFCGLSMGGMVGMWLGLNAPNRLDKLVLCNTAPKIGNADGWNTRIETVRRGGMKSVAATVCERWFTPAFRASSPEVFARVQHMIESMPPDGYAACCAAVRDFDERKRVAEIRAPALVIAGSQDAATPAADGRDLAEKIPGARYVELEASHLSNIEAAENFTAALLDFLTA